MNTSRKWLPIRENPAPGRRKIAMLSLLAIFLGCCFIHANAAEAVAFADHVRFGDESSEQRHSLQTSGNVKAENLTTTLGTITATYPVRTLTGKGASLSMSLQNPDASESVLLEIQEIHDRRPDAYGYTVLANGREVYYRTYEEIGAGPNHYFVDLPLEVAADGPMIEVTLRSEGGAPFSVGQIWLYGDFFTGIAIQEDTWVKMALYSDPNVAVADNTLTAAEKIEAAKKLYGDFECYGPFYPAHLYTYSQAVELAKNYLDKSLREAAQFGLPFGITANGSCYGGALGGPDGLGGDFSDVQYNPVYWNPVDGRRNASWPNIWNNVPSHSWANPRLVEVLRERFRQNITYLSERMCHLAAAGTLPDAGEFQFIRELGVNTEMFSDYNPYNVAAALREGVVLDPRGGISKEVRIWLNNSITRIYEWMSQDYAAALGRNPVRVDRGAVHYPSYQWLDNLYMHTYMNPIRPLADRRWGGWQTGIHPESWSNGEYGTGDSYDDYLRAQGSLAKINQERHSLMDQVGAAAKRQYEAGYRFVLYYSLYPTDDELLRQADKCDGEPAMPVAHFDPTCLDIVMDRDCNLGPANMIVEKNNLAAHLTACSHHTAKMAVEDPAQPGIILYRLTNNGEEFPSGLSLTAMGRVSAGEEKRIEIAVGEKPDNLKTVKVLRNSDLPKPEGWRHHQTSEIKVDLGDGAKGHKEYYLRLTFHSPKAFDAAFLHELQVGIKWPRPSGPIMGQPFTIGESRRLSLWIQDRAIARRSLERYRKLAGEDEDWRHARNLFERGLYKSCYQSLNGPLSEVLPVRYALRGHGALGKYPIELTLADADATAVVTLETVKPETVAFQVSSDVDQHITVRLSSLPAGQAYQVITGIDNQFRLERLPKPDGLSVVSTAEGALTVDLAVRAPAVHRRQMPNSLSGNYISQQRGRKEITISTQDLELMDYSSSMNIPVAADLEVSRQPDMLPGDPAETGSGVWPQPNDLVNLSLNDQGEVVKIEAFYGIDRGVIKSFHPPAWFPPTNGIVELDNGRKYELSPGTRCDMVALHNNLMQYEVESWQNAFKPGQPLEITYRPYTFNNSLPRVLSAKQPYKVVLDLDYRDQGDEWRAQIMQAEGINVVERTLDPTYLKDWIVPVLYPDQPFTPGEVVYKVGNDYPFEQVAIEFIGRVFEDSSRMEFLVSTDPNQDDWVKCADYNNGWSNYMVLFSASSTDEEHGTGKYAFVDVSEQVRGAKTFYLKLRLTRHADDCRYGLARVRVVTAQAANHTE